MDFSLVNDVISFIFPVKRPLFLPRGAERKLNLGSTFDDIAPAHAEKIKSEKKIPLNQLPCGPIKSTPQGAQVKLINYH